MTYFKKTSQANMDIFQINTCFKKHQIIMLSSYGVQKEFNKVDPNSLQPINNWHNF